MNTLLSTDALADVLKTIRLSSTTYFCTDFSSPWGMDIINANQGLFHVVVKGSCFLQLEDSSQVLTLHEGDIVAFPTGANHWIADQQKSVRLPAAELVEKVLAGENPFQAPDTDSSSQTLLCGAFEYDAAMQHPFLKDLPCFIHIKAQDTPDLDWLRAMINVLSQEARTPKPGSSIMVDRLTEVLFIQLIRFYMQTNSADMSYLAALADAKVGKALNMIHGEQEANLSIERLANAVGLSRTAFSEKFSALVGQSPKTYLLHWRLQRANRQLQQNKLSMFDIAEAAGYSSESAFNKAFKQCLGFTPGQARRKKNKPLA
ncbi:MAG: AraC family transcriptional regulator [Pseudomonadales bacterium]|nr:AraC family transcriptional regulator [Pseudomonadales bacterium]